MYHLHQSLPVLPSAENLVPW